MNYTWPYENNMFLNATKEDYLAALIISTYTDSALHARITDVFYEAQYVRYHPFHLAYLQKYQDWSGINLEKEGDTLSFESLIEQLEKQDVPGWDRAIQIYFPQGTSDYKKLMGKGRTFFKDGTYDERVAKVVNLGTRLGNPVYIDLATTKTDVIAKGGALTASRNLQIGQKSGTRTDSNLVEGQRVLNCVELFGITGLIMDHCRHNPELIPDCFDINALRRMQQKTFTSDINPEIAETIAKRKLVAGEFVTGINLASVDLYLSYSNEKDAPHGTVYYIMLANQPFSVAVELLGDLTTGAFVNIENPSLLLPGRYEITLP